MNKRNSFYTMLAFRMFSAFSMLLIMGLSVLPRAVSGSLTFTPIDCPGADFTIALGINARGGVVGNCRTSNDQKYHGFLLSDGGFTMIDFPGAPETLANDINDLGDICGSYYDVSWACHGYLCSASQNLHGFLLSGGSFSSIDFPGSPSTFLGGVNPAGQIVGSYQATDGHFHGLLVSQGAFTTIDFPGATDTVVSKINPSGRMVGYYIDGTFHGFISGPES